MVEKAARDCFYDTALEQTLRKLNVDELVITGLQTEYCMDTACRTALSREFDVTLVANSQSTGVSDMTAAR